MTQSILDISTMGKGLYLITDKIQEKLTAETQLPQTGLLNCFIQHTSASLMIQENADPTARADIQRFFDLIAPENQDWHQHTAEGPDDTTSHLKSALTQTSLNVPIVNGQLGLGTWQGIYLFEHRQYPQMRKVVLTLV